MDGGATGRSLRNQLLSAIRNSGLSERDLAEATGIGLMPILYFVRGKDLGIKQASKIAEFLGMELRPQSD